MKIKISHFGAIISNQEVGDKIYAQIKSALTTEENVVVDFSSVKTMATFCAKQIFGVLYNELTPEVFFQKIKMVNTSEDIRLIIRLGILSAINEDKDDY